MRLIISLETVFIGWAEVEKNLIMIIKYTGFRKHLTSSRRAMVAAAYEILLYRRRPFVVISAELRLIWHNLRFLLFLLPSLLVAGAFFAMIFP